VKDFMVDKIRNMVLIGHGGCGKTTLAEALVFNMGEINRMGTIDDGTTQSDYHPDEIERKISISTSLLQGEWKEWKMNILDTPGYSDFIGDTKASLRVAGLAVVVLNSIEGIEVGTEMVSEFADEYKIPLLFFANRLDNEHADFEKTLNSARERYGNGVVAVQFPVNSGEGFNKMVDCLAMKLFTLESDGKVTQSEIPEEFKARAVEARDKLIEAAAESDDTLLESYFEAGTLTEEQLVQGLHKGITSGLIKPLLGGAAFRNQGIKMLLDFIGKYGPSPSDRPAQKGYKPKSQDELERTASPDEPMSGLIFKTVSEAHVGELSLIRMYSGTIQSGNEILNSMQNETEKIGQIYFLNGRNRKEIGQLKAGDIGALVKLKHTSTGDTLCDKRDPIVWKPIQFPDPVISVAINPKSRGDEERISNGLHVLHD
jgi:elongation factor G